MKVYIEKENTHNFVVVPAPSEQELKDYHIIEMSEEEIDAIPVTHRYNPKTKQFEECPVLWNRIMAARRKNAFEKEADPLYKEWQFDLMSGSDDADESKQKWLDKSKEIKERFPMKEVASE
ncbi:MAG: hypothetical protein CMF22_11380 [Idiomarinaceae bacterium]|nr:hypothetical protein [Idiomarinaceae bacterium]|tara:strand:- start:102456 stop:102818 length:363 start_codon:yes stop_codon:yes gene_type:complete